MAALVHLTHSGLRIVTEELARQTFILIKSLLINHKYIIISRKLIIFHSLIKFCVLKTFLFESIETKPSLTDMEHACNLTVEKRVGGGD